MQAIPPACSSRHEHASALGRRGTAMGLKAAGLPQASALGFPFFPSHASSSPSTALVRAVAPPSKMRMTAKLEKNSAVF